MNYRLIVRLEAEADITKASVWYEEQVPGLGLEFTLDIGTTIRRVVENPFLFLRLRRNPEVRRALAHRFPYRIFFVVHDGRIVVFAVLHAARHEGRWRGRL